ncbi:MAG TPA: glutamine amidotransferase [Pirellulales bacterium]|jgi:uncharacterized membrane protein
MLRLVLSPVGGYLLVALAAAVLLGLLALGPGQSRVSQKRRRGLVALRLVIVLLIVLAMLRPTLVWTTISRKPTTVVILADQSRSMQIADAAGDKTRWESLRASLEAAQPELTNLANEIEVKVYTFDAEEHAIDVVDSPTQWPEKADGSQTAIGWVLDDTLRRETGKRLAGVVLLSDGAQRAVPAKDVPPQTPARRLADLGFPLYAVPFGQARALDQARDVALSDMRAPQVVFVKNEMAIEAVAQLEGFVGQDVVVQLSVETTPGKMEVVDSQRIRAEKNGDRLPIKMKYMPDSAGEKKVTLKAAPQTGELVTTNNEVSTFVTVLDGGLKVLYLNGALQPDIKFLRRSLDASPDMNVDFRTMDARKPETRPKDLDELFEPGRYDVYFIGDLDSVAFTERQLSALAQAVDRGAGLIMVGGFHSFGPGGYAATPLSKVLPVDMDRLERQNFGEAIRADLHLPEGSKLTMRPTRIGQTHSIMQLAPAAENGKAWEELPALDGANKLDRVQRGATVLAETPDNHPLLIARDFGRGRVLAFGGDSTWRWCLGGFEAAHKRFWRQVVLWLARKDQSTENSVWVNLDDRRYSPGARVEFTAGARDAHGEPIADATYDVEILRPDGSKASPRMRHTAGEMAGTYPDAQVAGDYTLIVKASVKGALIGSAQARFLVYDQDLELDNPAADRGMMDSLAAMTNGRTVAADQLGELFATIQKQLEQLEVETMVKRTLWDTWPFFLLLIALLGVEWWLRKKWGLV